VSDTHGQGHVYAIKGLPTQDQTRFYVLILRDSAVVMLKNINATAQTQLE